MLGEPATIPEDTSFRTEIAEMIVEALVLDDVAPADISPHDALFVDGLGLDSIDALELSFVIAQRYGIKLRSDDDGNAKTFSSLAALSQFIAENRSK